MNLSKLIDELDQITPEKIAEIGKKAKKRILQEYSWNYIVKEYENQFIYLSNVEERYEINLQ